MRTTRVITALATFVAAAGAVLASPGVAAASGFDEQFSSSTLDPAWSVYEFSGTRAYGYTSPANHYSLTANPGSLRYLIDPMTHWDGFLNGYQKTYGFHSSYTHDPGLELYREISGTNWVMESKASYYMPFTNGRGFSLRVYFGDGGAGTTYASFSRFRDGPWPSGTAETTPAWIELKQKLGADLSTAYEPGSYLEPTSYITPNAAGDFYYYRLERTGGLLTASWSHDAAAWTTVWSHDFGTGLDGLNQRVVITGLSWFNTAGSYADYDYVTVTPTDVTPPAISITTPANGATYTLGSPVLADYTCTEEAGGSGLATCVGDVADATAVDTSSVGAKSFTVTASDNLGNQSSLTSRYSVVYDFTGFFAPVDNLPVFNGVKAGAGVPVKFSLAGDAGLGVFAAGYPKSQATTCDSTATVDGVEETVTAGSSGLSYDPILNQYTYVWKTAKSWAGSCRQLVVQLADGLSYRANFSLK